MSNAARAVLVTGGAKRVGRAIALALAEAGFDVCIHYNSSAREAEDVAQQIATMGRRTFLVQADLRQEAAWSTVVTSAAEQFGRLDVLVNNASVFEPDRGRADAPGNLAAAGTTATESPPSDADKFNAAFWEETLRINLLAPVALSWTAAPWLRATGCGSIVNLLDAMTDRALPRYTAYMASKVALHSATRNLARLLAPAVRVFGVSPGIAEFPAHYDEAVRRRLVSAVPQARAGRPEEVATLVRFLIEQGDYMTGAIVPIDGGRGLV